MQRSTALRGAALVRSVRAPPPASCWAAAGAGAAREFRASFPRAQDVPGGGHIDPLLIRRLAPPRKRCSVVTGKPPQGHFIARCHFPRADVSKLKHQLLAGRTQGAHKKHQQLLWTHTAAEAPGGGVCVCVCVCVLCASRPEGGTSAEVAAAVCVPPSAGSLLCDLDLLGNVICRSHGRDLRGPPKRAGPLLL